MKYLILLILVTSITGCVSKSNYDDIKSEKENLEVELANIKSENEKLKQELSEINDELNSVNDELSSVKLNYNIVLENKKQAEVEKTKVRYYSEAEALEFLKDYYDFYHTGYIYRNVKTRRVNDNTFIFSLEESSSFKKMYVGTTLYDLWINNDGTYKMQRRFD